MKDRVLRFTDREFSGDLIERIYLRLGILSDEEVRQFIEHMVQFGSDVGVPVKTDPNEEEFSTAFMQIVNMDDFGEGGPYAAERLACLRCDADWQAKFNDNYYPEYGVDRYRFFYEVILCSRLLLERRGIDYLDTPHLHESQVAVASNVAPSLKAKKNEGTEVDLSELNDPGFDEDCYVAYFINRDAMKEIKRMLREKHADHPRSDNYIKDGAERYASRHDLCFTRRDRGRPESSD